MDMYDEETDSRMDDEELRAQVYIWKYNDFTNK